MKRIRGKIMGKLVSIAWKDWQQLRRRFDPANTLTDSGQTIHIACPLCKRHDDKCYKCTFNKFQTKKIPIGCKCLVRYIIGGRPVCWYTEGRVSWSHSDKKRAMQELKKLRDFMDALEMQND